jgi:D-xylose transport system substrate-binding protein
MRKTGLSIAVFGVASALALTACSSSSGGGGSSSSAAQGGGGGSSSSAAGGSSSSSGGAVSGKVGVILPDTTTSNRYTQYDQPLLKKAFDAAGIQSDIQNAHGSNSNFVSIAQTMDSQGVKVLLIDPADPATGVSVEKSAGAAGVPVIDYDRVNLGGSAQYYVSFDNEKVGEQQGAGLVQCLKQSGSYSKKPSIIQLNGGTDIDNNAVLFKAGAHKILDPLFKSGALVKGPETDVKGWDNTVAATDFQQAYTQDPKVGGVLAANDGIAAAAISTLKQHGTQVPVTGQDATLQGLQYILSGDQCLTIFKDVRKEANAAAQLAIDIIKGDKASASKLASGSLHDPKNGRNIPSLLLKAQVIFKSNIKDVISAGAVTKAQLCTSKYASACSKAGV